jgi:hypothetical protein
MLPEEVSSLAPKLPDDETEPFQHRLAPQLAGVYTRLVLGNGQLPPSEWGRLLAHSYSQHGNWYVMMILSAYQFEGTGPFAEPPTSAPGLTTVTFPGDLRISFLPSEYHQRVAPVDLAVTFASLAGVNQPSAAVGRVLTEAIRTIRPAPTQ